MEYEKTFHPFAIMAKKKYIGNKFENDIYYCIIVYILKMNSYINPINDVVFGIFIIGCMTGSIITILILNL